MVERQDPDNFTRFQARERCALQIAAYAFNLNVIVSENLSHAADQDGGHQPITSAICSVMIQFLLSTNMIGTNL